MPRVLIGCAAALLAIPLLAGCSSPLGVAATVPASSASAPTAGGSAPASPAPSSSGAQAPTASTGTAAGPAPSATTGPAPVASGVSAASGACTGGTRGGIPAGARTMSIGDLDGDHRTDRLFLTTSAPWRFGVATAAGGVLAVADTLPAGGAHHVFLASTDGQGRVLVLDDGVQALFFRYDGCAVTQLQNSRGTALSIGIGARSATGGAFTGVACNDQNGGILVEAVQARERTSGRYDVVWWTLNPVRSGSGFQFTDPDARYRSLAASDPKVAAARTSSCWAAKSLTATHQG